MHEFVIPFSIAPWTSLGSSSMTPTAYSMAGFVVAVSPNLGLTSNSAVTKCRLSPTVLSNTSGRVGGRRKKKKGQTAIWKQH